MRAFEDYFDEHPDGLPFPKEQAREAINRAFAN